VQFTAEEVKGEPFHMRIKKLDVVHVIDAELFFARAKYLTVPIFWKYFYNQIERHPILQKFSNWSDVFSSISKITQRLIVQLKDLPVWCAWEHVFVHESTAYPCLQNEMQIFLNHYPELTTLFTINSDALMHLFKTWVTRKGFDSKGRPCHLLTFILTIPEPK
jgi:hypothetical protein